MANLQELLAQREALEKQIAQQRQAEASDALNKVRELVKEFGLTESDIFGKGKSSGGAKPAGKKVAPKYRDPATGNTWTGRGIAPKWLQGKDKAQFLIA
jgi:DNA-binding protein H-NS